jgi:polyketide synthase PksN
MLPEDETEVRYVNGVREVRTFRPFELEATDSTPIRAGGVYLITGGLGGLGLIFARYLVRERGARVVLMGRSTPDEAAEGRLKELGASAVYVQGDVCNESDLDRCIEMTHRMLGPIQGVIHAAGLHHDAFIRNKQADEAAEVIRPKTVGTAVLDKATASEPLDFFVVFSSIAGVTGNVGQCDYAFANAYLNAFVAARAELHAQGERPGKSLSISWPLWKHGGMRLAPALAALKSGGLLPLDTAEGIRIFEAALASGESQVTAIVTDPSDNVASPLAETNASSPVETETPSQPRQLGAIELLTKRFSTLTKIPPDRIQPSGPLENYGIDSILVMSFTKLLEQDFGPLSKTLLFEYQTLEALAAYFEAHHAETLERLLAERAAPREAEQGSGAETVTPAPLTVPSLGEDRKAASQGSASATRAEPSFEDDQEIAIVGLYGRFPKAESPEDFWKNLAGGRDCIDEVPLERWDYRDYFDAKPSAAGKTYNRWGGFLSDIDKFDASFFRIPPREAEVMDPQERLFLETVWHTLEDAGYRKSSLQQRSVGVFVGVMYGQYQLLGLGHSRPGQLLSVSSSYASIANRVSYFFDWSGPSMAVDTMCSSSLTAIHLACESIRNGQSEIAIAGGVNLALHPLKDVGLAQGGYAAEDGRCKSFGAGGDGYVPGEGVGAVLLKPKAQAIADGDHIYAVIKATCINHGGKTNGYSVPNPNAQSDVIAGALKKARIDPRTISYLEAHGTGTPLGDPIEITGLGHAFQRAANGDLPRQYCAIGSAKSSIGHLEAAAGVAGLTKVLLQMRYRRLAPSLHATETNPYIPFEETPFAVQRETGPWRTPNGVPRRAGISSFGAGGSNAHLIVEEFAPAGSRPGDAIPGPYLMVFSAANEDRLTALARDFQDWIAGLSEPESDRPALADVAYTLQVGREGLGERLAFSVSSWDELAERLKGFVGSDPAAAVVRGSVKRDAGRSESLLSGEEGRQFLEALIRRRNLEKLASLWVSGVEIDWAVLWRERPGRRVSLPVYPFARVRHWLAPPWDCAGVVDTRAPRLGALVHWNESTLKEQRFGSRFHEADLVIRDHRVEGRPMLPGAATIEMVLQAVRLAAETDAVQLVDIAWLKPFTDAGDGIEVRVALHPKGPDKLAFELRDAAGTVNAEGRAVLRASDATASLALDQIKARCPRTIEPAALYRGFAERGLSYGPGFRTVRDIGAGDDEVWSLLELPTDWDSDRDAYRLHPALLDGALQSLAMIAEEGGLEVPFAVDRVTCLAALPARCVAVGRRSGSDTGPIQGFRVQGSGCGSTSLEPRTPSPAPGLNRYDIGIFDLDGRGLALIEGAATRSYGAVLTQGDPVLFRTLWKPAPIEASAEPLRGPILLLDDKGDLAAELGVEMAASGLSLVRVTFGTDYVVSRGLARLRPDRPEDYASLLGDLDASAIVMARPEGMGAADIIRLHLLTQAALKRGRPLRLLYLYPFGDPAGEAVGAYAKSLRLEQPRMRLKALGVEGATRAAILLEELRDESPEVQYEGGQRLVRSIAEIPPEATVAGAPIPRGAVLLVTGGLGGLARIFATYLVEEFKARVLLVGRSALDDEKAQALKPFGDRAFYLQADISRVDEAARVVAEAKQRYGRLDGVLHTAGVLNDGLIWNKTAEEFDAVLRPKVAGVEALDEATRAEPLSVFVVFSSTAGLFGNAGQADYAYANAYLDAFAHRRERQRRSGTRQGRTVSIDWPLWCEGGMRGDADRLSAVGLVPIDRSSGWALFRSALASGEAQVFACLGDKAAVRGWLSRMERTETTERPDTTPSVHTELLPSEHEAGLTREIVVEYLTRHFAELTKLPVADVLPDEPIENYGLDSIMVSTFSQMLEHDLGELSKTILFEFPTLEALGGYLFDNYAAGFAAYLARRGAAPSNAAAPSGPVDYAPAVARFMPPPREATQDEPTAHEPGPQTVSVPVDDPIAIIGVAGRYPMAGNLEEFWENLAAGRDCIEEVPNERWATDAIYDPRPMKPGKTRNKWGGFIRDMDKFDPVFFNIAPLEAQYMDPQERMFLETVWHTLEDAGCTKTGLEDREVGVFVGAMYGHYQLYGVEARLRGNPVSLSSNFSTIANRVSYFFNWHGPSFAVDSMCSSSLTTIHLACESLRRGECELAVAGGVNATVHPEKDLILSQSGFSASDGRCRAFGDGGDGYVPAEGVGAVLLKPLSRAVADGDRIYGVVRASALNHGGKTNGYTVPNSRSQTEVIASALRQSGIDPGTITYVEAHGTGTSLGDPIEIEGLQQAFSEALCRHGAGPEGRCCAIGSVKSNIGHCEAAAGIAGVTKVLLQMRHGQLVPSIHAEPPNPRVKLAETHFRVQRALEPWTALQIDGQRIPRRAGISSFGAGGANAHIVLEEYLDPVAESAGAGPEILVLSARTGQQLKEMAANLGRFLYGRAMSLRDVAFTLQSGREALGQRLALVVSDIDECARKLIAWSAADGQMEGIHRGTAKRSSSARNALLPSAHGDLNAWAAWWVAGGDIDWAELRGGAPARVVSLPCYPFLRQRFWVPNQTTVGAVDPGVLTPIANTMARAREPLADVPKSAMGFGLIFFTDNGQVSESEKYRVVLETAKYADEHGFDAIWAPERHFHPFGGIYASPSVLMASLATITRRIRLRAGSVILPLQDPLRVAEEWAVVDNLSGGRVDLAFASGWNPNDFALAPENHARLRDIWLARIPEVQRLWRGETIQRINGKGDKVDLRIYPRPLQKELPIWLTASRRVETFIDAGKNGYNVLTMLQGSTLEQLTEKIARYREARAEAGFDPQAGKVTLMLHTFVDADPARASDLVREPFLDYIASSLDAHKTAIQGGDKFSSEDLRKMAVFSFERYCREASLIGDPAGCMEMVGKCHAAGVNEIACLVDFGAAPDDVLASLPALDALRALAAAELPVVATAAEARTRPPGAPASIRATAPQPRGRFFTPVWAPRAVDTSGASPWGRVLLIHSAEHPLNNALVQASRAQTVQRIRLGHRSRRLDDSGWEVDLSDPVAIEGSLKQVARPDLILFTSSIGLSSPRDEVARAEGAQQATVIACLRTMKALHALGWLEHPPAMRMVTAGTFEVDPGEPVCPDGAGLFGVAGSLAREMPRLDIACVDLRPAEIEDLARLPDLAHAVLAESPQRAGEVVALRGGERWQQRLKLTELPRLESPAFRRRGVYLIVGGTGNVGQVLGEALARKYGAKLVLTGRRAWDGKIEQQIERIRRAGGDARYVQARADDLAEMRNAVDLAVSDFGGINGIIHSAMVMQHALTRKMDETEMRGVLDPKTKGSAVLLELTRDLPLDFLLFMGSAQSFFCEARHAVYAAACCLSDAYARLARQHVSFPVRVVHWGFWAHSLDAAMRATLGAAGLGVVRPEDGFDAVEGILQDGPAAVGYLSANDDALSRMGMDPNQKVIRLGSQNEDSDAPLDETVLSQIFA